MTQPTGKARKGAGRVAFLAHADEFRALLTAGHPQRAIYDDHAAGLGISYSQFNRYVGKYLLEKADNHEHQRKGTGQAPQSGAAPAGSQARGPDKSGGKPDKPGAFKHNASGSDRDDLI